jgi:DNA-binding beta-propeller fold protein YncE
VSRVLTSLIAALACACATAAQAADPPGRIGPDLKITGNGRALHPIGDLTQLGNFPTASALTPDGRFLWAVNSGHGINDVQVVDLVSGKVIQTLPLPGAFGGIAFTPDGTRAFVSGTPAGEAKRDGALPGAAGDVVHVFDVDPASGKGSERAPVSLPSQSGGSGQNNSLPPVSKLYPSSIAVSPDATTVAVIESQADRVAFFRPSGGGVYSTARVGRYPSGIAYDRDGRAYVSNAYDGTVSVLAPHGGVATTIKVSDINSQPEGIVADPRRDRVYVAVTQRDAVAVIDTHTQTLIKTIGVGRSEGSGVQPTALALDPDAQTLYVADSGEDTVAAIALADRPASNADPKRHSVYRPPSAGALRAYARSKLRGRKRHALHERLIKTVRVQACAGPTKRQARSYRDAVLKAQRGPASKRKAALRRALKRLPAISRCASDGAITGMKAFELIGKLPTAAYPTSLQVTPDAKRLLWIAGKGFGTGPNPEFVFDGSKSAFGKVETPYGQYVLDKFAGQLGRLALPSDKQIRAMTKAAEAQAVPANAQPAPAGTPVRKDGPIKHVFYVVRENRTYDQVFGSERRGDGDARLELFDDNGVAGPTGGVTPNAHALARKFPLLDHVYADSEVSVDGHIITAGSLANDYVQKSTAQNYSRPGRSFDFGIYPITFGPNGFVFDQAVRQGVTFRNYGELGAGTTPLSNTERPTYLGVQANTDLTFPSNLQIGCLTAAGAVGNLAACAQDSGVLGPNGQTLSGIDSRISDFALQFTAQLATGTVPAFNYMILPNDHTNGTTPNAYTSQAFIADNDFGLGQLVDLISHSSIWASSAIFVVEDDSQDGADHVDAHRMPAFAISPWAKRGAVVSTRYDQYSVLRTAELMAGLAPLSINDALATPMYDAFDSTPDVEGTRYDAIRPEQPLNEINGPKAPLAAFSRALPFERLDYVPQALMDRILWASVHGEDSTAPAPGPNASPEEHARALGALRVLARGGDARAWLLSHTQADGDDAAETRTGEQAPAIKLPASVQAQAAAEARRILSELR